jgi:hypothetical protein
VVIPIDGIERCGVIDYMVIGHDAEHARDLEQRTQAVLGFIPGRAAAIGATADDISTAVPSVVGRGPWEGI